MPNDESRPRKPAVTDAGKNQDILNSLLQTAALVAQNSAEIEIPPKSVEEKIAELEARIQAMHGDFSWYLHNELRHHYLEIDARESRRHADIILRHSMMDHYILNTLSDWHFRNGNPEQGIARLAQVIDLYEQYPSLQAACLVHMGDKRLDQRRVASAIKAYERVLKIDDSEIAQYKDLAQRRLNE